MILQPYYSHITIILQLPYDLITTLSLKGEALYTTLIGRCPKNCDKSVTYHSDQPNEAILTLCYEGVVLTNVVRNQGIQFGVPCLPDIDI